MFRDIRKKVKENLNKDTIFTSPHAANKEENVHNNSKIISDKKVLKKWGLSFGSIEDLLRKEKKELFLSKENELVTDNLLCNEDCLSYKNVLEEILINQYTDFRKYILMECILHDEDFQEDDFEKFILYLEFFISILTGVQCKYFIDELGFLNMDFYSNEQSLMTLAEIIHYKMQFKIMNKATLIKYKSNKINKDHLNFNKKSKDSMLRINAGDEDHVLGMRSDLTEALLGNEKGFYIENCMNPLDQIDDELEKINNIPYEGLDFEDVSLFPPYADFTKKSAHYFRRYDKEDNYHLCELCRNLNTCEETYDLKCSSVFRDIDRTRIIYSAVSNAIDVNKIQESENSHMKALFKFIFIMHNYEELEKLTQYVELVKEYTWPIENQNVIKINKQIKNTFGEDFGFYFFWVTHYLNWLVLPGMLGLFLYLAEMIIFIVEDTKLFLYINLVFAGVVILWAHFYLNSWKSKEKFLRTIWGMEDFKIDSSNEEKDVPVDRWSYMGLTMPIVNKFEYYIKRVFSTCVILICLCLTIGLNVFILYLENSQVYEDFDIPFGQNEIRQISYGYWLYCIPVVSYMLREYMSRIYRRVALYLTNNECHFHTNDYKSAMRTKIIFYEFFNYYFSLYYIAFFKRYVETCPMDDCYSLLATQLTGILVSSIIVDVVKVLWYAVYKRKKQKSFENNLKEKNPNVNNKSSKYIYYTRKEYEASDASGEILEIVMNYGYIIQFGACSPISFFIALLQTIVMRFTDALKISRIQYVRLISESQGIGVNHRVLKFMTFLGLITNVCIIFFTDTAIVPGFSLTDKFLFLILIENLVLVVVMFSGSKNPQWYRYKDKLEITYLKKYSYNVGDNNVFYETEEDQEIELKKLKVRQSEFGDSITIYQNGIMKKAKIE